VTLRLSVIVPTNGDMPAAGWPIAITSHGTGGDYLSDCYSGDRDTCTALAREGLAGTGQDQPLHGTRWCDATPTPCSEDMLELYSFNFFNPEAGRSVQRQSIADSIYLMRLLREDKIVVPASLSRHGREEHFDPSHTLFFGHSQGGITGALLFAVEDRLRGGVLSGTGGGLSTTIMLRTNPMDFSSLVATAIGLNDPTELSEFHPVLALVQMMVDVTDPLAYAGSWLQFDATDPAATPRSVLLTEGLLDQDTPSPTAEALAVAAGFPVIKPYASWCAGAQALGIQPIDSPVQGNLASGGQSVTGAQAQYPNDDHFAVYDNANAYQTYQTFLGTLVDGPGTIDYQQ
jgi:hypothetical protein